MATEDSYWRLKELFAASLEIPREERDAFLNNLPPQDSSLIEQVRELLKAYDRATALVGAAAPAAAVTMQAEITGEKVGDQIGPYKLLELVGEGGMGIVYKAEQSAPVRRIVALKLIKLGMDTRQVIARFESERQALALINHPNVAAVFDAGATQSGRPYFVMEWVNGATITSFCDRNQYTTRQRLELFTQACDAIQHAHQKAIIHRDIKPGNILVTSDGEKPVVKVIDFGVAKATAQRLIEQTIFTEAGQFVGTPEYMSPEQANLQAIDVDTRTDIYSLGVVLYELLVGALPFDSKSLRAAAYAQIQSIIRDIDPPRPSTRLSSLGQELAAQIAVRRHTALAALERELRNELEWIPLKAMRKDRTQRYPTAIDFAQDIHNYLNNRPLVAAPESRAYRTKKFLLRNRPMAFAVGAVAIALIAGIVGTSIGLIGQSRQRIEAQRQEQIAQEKSAIADAVSGFQEKMLQAADPNKRLGDKVTVVEVITAAAKTLDEGTLRNQPVVEARARRILGNTFLALGRYREAEQNLRRAIELFDASFPNGTLDCAGSLSDLGSTLGSLGNSDAAEAACHRAIEMYSKLIPANDLRIYVPIHQLGVLLRNRGQIDEAEAMMRKGLSIRRKVIGRDDIGTANILHDLALVQRSRKNYADAERLLREALQIYREALGANHPYVAATLHNLGGLAHDQEKYTDAEDFYRQALQIYRASLPTDHPYIATTLNDLGYVLQAEKRFADALPLHQEALESFQKAVGNDHWNTANSNLAMGQTLIGLRRFAEAQNSLLEARRVFSIGGSEMEGQLDQCDDAIKSLHAQWNDAEPGTDHPTPPRNPATTRTTQPSTNP